jgi:cellobiose-specific phosphotransferase system component IIC
MKLTNIINWRTFLLAVIIFLTGFVIYVTIQIVMDSNAVEIEEERHPEELEPILID